MDGIAVAERDLVGSYPRVLAAESYTWLDTGDPVPEGCERVVVREAVATRPDGTVQITQAPSTRPVRPVGEDITAGAVVLPGGHRIRPVDLAAVAAAGYVSIGVRRRPRVAIVPTGDEIRPLGSTLAAGEILDTNSVMLEGLLAEAGCQAWVRPVVPDIADELVAAFAAAAHAAEVVVVIAGSSAGRDDHTGAVIARLGRVAVAGVAIRPGHPVVLGVLGGDAPDGAGDRPAAPAVPVVGVPGYPGSAKLAFDEFIRPLARRMLGMEPATDHRVMARLAVAVGSSPRLEEYLRVRIATVVEPVSAAAHLVAVPLPRGAAALSTLTGAEAVLRIPVGVDRLLPGAPVWVAPVPGAAFAGSTTILAGRATAALDTLVEVHREHMPAGVLHRGDVADEAALDALAAGLCHAAAVSLPLGDAHLTTAERLAVRLGPIIVLEIARSGDWVDTLIVPAVAFDSAPVVALRSTLSSMPLRRRLRDLPGWSGRSTGRGSWYAPPDSGSTGTHDPDPSNPDPSNPDPSNGVPRCATR
jgi:putative molybdopterin biosynthesis protein